MSKMWRRTELNLRNVTIAGNGRDSCGQSEEERTQYHLPDELWEKIVSKLTLKGNIHASAVSKRFLAIANSVKKTDKPPLLVIAPKSGDSYKFFAPFERKPYFFNFPELIGTRFVHSKDGWLVMSNPNTFRLFLFCPYTRELIKLPTISLESREIALSSAPTSLGFVIFLIDHIDLGKTRIKTWRSDETQWNDIDLPNEMHPCFVHWKKVIFCNGVFYCFSFRGPEMGIFDPKKNSWIVQSVIFSRVIVDWWRNGCILEHDGDIIAAHPRIVPVMYKLDLFNKIWVRIKSLGGRSLFINDLSCHAKGCLVGNMRNNIYFSVLCRDRCLLYSLERGRYFPRYHQWPGLGERDRLHSIWIDAPEEDLSAVQ